jgi:hypothetical protein
LNKEFKNFIVVAVTLVVVSLLVFLGVKTYQDIEKQNETIQVSGIVEGIKVTVEEGGLLGYPVTSYFVTINSLEYDRKEYELASAIDPTILPKGESVILKVKKHSDLVVGLTKEYLKNE